MITCFQILRGVGVRLSLTCMSWLGGGVRQPSGLGGLQPMAAEVLSDEACSRQGDLLLIVGALHSNPSVKSFMLRSKGVSAR
jgi:hypothetical protein